MRPRFVICLSILVIVILTIVFWLRPARPSARPNQTQLVQTVSNAPEISGATSNPAAQGISNVPTTTSSKIPNPLLTTNRRSIQDVVERFIESKNRPVDFYGQVIDQDSNVLSGVEIKSTVEQITMPDPSSGEFAGSKYIKVVRTTDAAGRFEISGLDGDGFGIGLTKNGYEAEPGQRSFGPVGGSYENPVIFKMWSTNIHEQLITGNKNFEIVPDGRPYFINLTDGTLSEHESGDLKVWIQYTNQVVQRQLYDWSAEIDVIDGGLVEDHSPAMYVAPTDGYVPTFKLQQRIKGGQSGEIGDRSFYLILKNGQEYGKMNINLYAPYGYLHPGLIHLSYAINPSGSRILR